MNDKKLTAIIHRVNLVLKGAFATVSLLLIFIVMISLDIFLKEEVTSTTADSTETSLIVFEGVHVETGLIDDLGLILVVENCTSCHSAQLITQNRMSREGWSSTIRWMQETQNLWDLGADEETILNYLTSNYAPQKSGRRKNLGQIDWYKLEE